MSLTTDLDQILHHVLPVDPSFGKVEEAVLARAINATRQAAKADVKDAFLLSAMQLLALAENGHTRLIPNAAIEVLPLRLVYLGTSLHLVGGAVADAHQARGEVMAVNGVPVEQIEAAAASYLAGTPQRQRVIGPILFAWPAALAHLGFAHGARETRYRVRQASGQIVELALDHDARVPGSTLYPRNEHGNADPAWSPDRFADLQDWRALGLSITLPSFLDPDAHALPAAISHAAHRVRSSPETPIVTDLRGNTGGNFLLTLPLIHAIADSLGQCQAAVIVDKFTFSAAIVFVAILKHRLGPRLTIIGEEMGDRPFFFAEGGVIDLPASGAEVRYSTAFHDWQTGLTDKTTPPEIARHVVAAGPLEVDHPLEAIPGAVGARDMLYPALLESLGPTGGLA